MAHPAALYPGTIWSNPQEHTTDLDRRIDGTQFANDVQSADVVLLATYAASGAITITVAGAFANWADDGLIINKTTNEKMRYRARTNDTLTIDAAPFGRARDGTAAAAGSINDHIYYVETRGTGKILERLIVELTTFLAEAGGAAAPNGLKGSLATLLARLNTSINADGTLNLNPFAGTANFTGTFKRQGYNIYFQNATPAIVAGDFWYEINTGLIWLCDGTYWLSFELFQMTGSLQSAASGQNFGLTPTRNNQGTYYDLLLFDFCGVLNFAAANTNTDYWNIKLQRLAANGATTDIATITGQGQTSAQYIAAASQRINARLQSSTDAKIFTFLNVITGAPGNLYCACSFTYRWIHP